MAKGQADLHQCWSFPSPQELLKETSQGPPTPARLPSSHCSSNLTVARKLRAMANQQPCPQPTWPSLNSSRQIAQTGAELQLLAESHRDVCRHLAWYLRVASCPMACMVCCCKESCQGERKL